MGSPRLPGSQGMRFPAADCNPPDSPPGFSAGDRAASPDASPLARETCLCPRAVRWPWACSVPRHRRRGLSASVPLLSVTLCPCWAKGARGPSPFERLPPARPKRERHDVPMSLGPGLVQSIPALRSAGDAPSRQRSGRAPSKLRPGQSASSMIQGTLIAIADRGTPACGHGAAGFQDGAGGASGRAGGGWNCGSLLNGPSGLLRPFSSARSGELDGGELPVQLPPSPLPPSGNAGARQRWGVPDRSCTAG